MSEVQAVQNLTHDIMNCPVSFTMRIKKPLLYKLLAGISVITILVVMTSQSSKLLDIGRSYLKRLHYERLAREYSDESTLFVNTSVADQLAKDVRILCFVLTTNSKVDTTIPILNATWGRRCNKILFVFCPKRDSKDYLNTCHIGKGYSHLTGKVRHAFITAYKKYINEYDWFLKADDDSYLVIENLRFVLSHYKSKSAGYLRFHFQKFMHQGYISGGGGYVLNREGLRKLVEWGFFVKDKCAIDGEIEDKEIGMCLEESRVPVLSSLDKFERQTLHTDKVWQHVWGTFPKYLVTYSRENMKDGSDCCSQFLISFHHVDAGAMIFLHHLLYRTSVYGRNMKTEISGVFPMNGVPPKAVVDYVV